MADSVIMKDHPQMPLLAVKSFPSRSNSCDRNPMQVQDQVDEMACFPMAMTRHVGSMARVSTVTLLVPSADGAARVETSAPRASLDVIAAASVVRLHPRAATGLR